MVGKFEKKTSIRMSLIVYHFKNCICFISMREDEKQNSFKIVSFLEHKIDQHHFCIQCK